MAQTPNDIPNTITPPDDTRGPLVTGIVSATFVLATISVFARSLVRFKRHAHGWDDYTIYIAWVTAIIGEIATIFEAHYGMGRHLVYVASDLSNFIRTTTWAEINVSLGIGFVKLSVCIFVLRVIRGTHHNVALALYLVIAMNSVITIVAVFCLAFQCRPLAKAWNPELPGSCFSAQVLTNITRVVGAFGCLTDFMCVLVPVFILRGLQMKKNVKYAMIGVMLLGLFTAACSIGKAVTSEFINSDPPWQDVDVTIWTATEHQMGIFVACLPSLRPVLDTVTGTSWKNLLSWTYSKRSISDSKQNEHEEFYTQRQQFEQLGSDVSDMLPLKHYKQVRDSTDAE